MKILQDIIDDPQGPDFLPIPLFENRAQALAHFLYVNANFGARGGLSNAQNGRADVTVLARVLQHQDRYWPRVQNHGGFALTRHMEGTQFDYAALFRAMRVPILAFASDGMDNGGLAWSERVWFSAHATSAVEVEFQVLKEWGHLDVLWGTNASESVFAPMVEWFWRRAEAGAKRNKTFP